MPKKLHCNKENFIMKHDKKAKLLLSCIKFDT